jgi:hypothetical protein
VFILPPQFSHNESKGKGILQTQDVRTVNIAYSAYYGQQRGVLAACVSIFIISFVVLFLGMDRQLVVHDEGFMLTGAQRVVAGGIPHRDFYANYGPAQFYILAGLFNFFGQFVVVERVFDLLIKAAIVTMCFYWTAAYCSRRIAVLTALTCMLWFFSFFIFGSPLMPVTLLSFVGSILILPVFTERISTGRVLAAGAVTGLTALFRYDAGFGLLAVHGCFIVIAAALHRTSFSKGLQEAISVLSRYVAGTVIVFLPPALLYLAVAPIHPFVHDIILYPSKYYAHARSLPFPVGIHPRKLDEFAVYLPVIVVCILVWELITDRSYLKENQRLRGLLILLGLLIPVFYIKGIVRVGIWHMYLAIVFSLILLAVLFHNLSSRRPVLRAAVIAAMIFSVSAATLAALKKARYLRKTRTSVLAELLSPPGPAAINDLTGWCNVPNPLHKGLCFLVDTDHLQAITFIDSHTGPRDALFVGVPRHDRIFASDSLTYFAAGRAPATKWYEFDPDLQSRADIQSEMIQEIDSKAVPYIILDSEFDNSQEPNDSSKSSGVTLLDDYIRRNYRQVELFGTMSVWQRSAPQS